MSRPLKIMLVAAEASGDALGAGLAKALKARLGGDVTFVGVGGPKMAAEGVVSPFDIAAFTPMPLRVELPAPRFAAAIAGELPPAIPCGLPPSPEPAPPLVGIPAPNPGEFNSIPVIPSPIPNIPNSIIGSFCTKSCPEPDAAKSCAPNSRAGPVPKSVGIAYCPFMYPFMKWNVSTCSSENCGTSGALSSAPLPFAAVCMAYCWRDRM